MDDFMLNTSNKIAKLVHLCKDTGADINAQKDYNGTVLHKAAHLGSLPLVRVIIDLGADVYRRSLYPSNFTPLQEAISKFRIDTPKIVEALCMARADSSRILSHSIRRPVKKKK
jgi:ankyrin repeat protein